MKINPSFKIQIKTGLRIPIFKLNENHDFHFIPFFVDQGQSFSSRMSYNKVLFERVFSSEKTQILKTIDWEEQMIPFDLAKNEEVSDLSKISDSEAKKLVFKRKYKIGTYFVGKVLDFQMRTKFKLGRFLKQKINTDLTIYFNNPFIWNKEKKLIVKTFLYCFYQSPQLAPNDVLFISKTTVYLDIFGNYICHICQFSSIEETFSSFGRNIDTQIQFATIGSVPILPKVAERLNYNLNVPEIFRKKEILFFEPEKTVNWIENGVSKTENLYIKQTNSKKLYIDDFHFQNTKGITNFQFESNGFIGFLGVEITGRVIHKREKDNLILGRSQRFLTHQNLPFQNTPFSISKAVENDWIIISGMQANIRLWNDAKIEKGLVFTPDQKRSQKLILEVVGKKLSDFQNEEFNVLKNERIDIKQNLINKNSLIYNPFYDLKLKEDEIIDLTNKKLKIYEQDFIKSKLMNFSEFNNINVDLMKQIDHLTLGSYLLTNNKGFWQDIISDSLGFLGGLVGKFTKFFNKSPAPILTGFGSLSYLAKLGFKYTPDSFFYSKNLLKMSSKINIAFPRKAIEYLANELTAKQNLYIPLEFVMGTWSNTFSQFFGGENTRVAINFSLTEKFIDKNGIVQNTADLLKNQTKLPIEIFKTVNSNHEGFVIEKITIKQTSSRKIKLSFWNKNEIQNYFEINSQAKFSNVLNDLKTDVFLGSFNENFSNIEKFNSNIVDSQELQAFSLATYLEKIEQMINADNLNNALNQAKQAILSDLNFEFSKTSESYWNLDQETKLVSQNFNFELSFSQKWNLLKKLKFTKNDGTIEHLFQNDESLKKWLIEQYKSIVLANCLIESTMIRNEYNYIQNKTTNERIKIKEIGKTFLQTYNFEFHFNNNYNFVRDFQFSINQTFQKKWILEFWVQPSSGLFRKGYWWESNSGFTIWPFFEINDILNFKIQIENYNFDFDISSKKFKISFNLLKIEKNKLQPTKNATDIFKLDLKIVFKAKLELKNN